MEEDADDPNGIRIEEFYPHAPGTVWHALATPDHLANWMLEHRGYRPVEGTLFRINVLPLPTAGFSGALACEVVRVTEDEVLSIRWWDAKSSELLVGTVTWKLRPDVHGTSVALSHIGFDMKDAGQRFARRVAEQWWLTAMTRLGVLVEQLDGVR